MVTVTCCVALPPWPSSTVTVMVSRIGPLARGVHNEGAVDALAGVVERPGVGVGRVDVGFGQLAADNLRTVLGHAAGDGAADGRGVIGAGDGDRDDLLGRAALAVADGHGDGIGHLLAIGQGLHLGVGVVQGVGPLACIVDHQLAIRTLAVVVDRPG
ncbi:hypothetical protein G6F22_017652 [Rhizopus arrhizus]|nr:hypothetical protein G6F22_017652 [Rhizopus arrhizus]